VQGATPLGSPTQPQVEGKNDLMGRQGATKISQSSKQKLAGCVLRDSRWNKSLLGEANKNVKKRRGGGPGRLRWS